MNCHCLQTRQVKKSRNQLNIKYDSFMKKSGWTQIWELFRNAYYIDDDFSKEQAQ